MTKNILVTDINGRITGATYPKRAKGLIGSGRATWVDEQTIRLVGTVYTDAFSDDKEEFRMAEIIEFKARAFKLDEECETNKGTRLIVTENDENVECFEIGENGAKTEILSEVELEADKDYVFRFTVKSRFVKCGNAESSVNIYFDEKDDGYTYPLDREDKNRFKSVVCKKTEDGLLRVFELPFNSGDATSCTIEISVNNMTAWIYPAKEKEAYDSLEDVVYEQWRQDELHRIQKVLTDIGGTLGDTLNGFGELVGKAGDKIAKTVSDVINRPAAENKDEAAPEPAEEAAEEAAEAPSAEEAPAAEKEEAEKEAES
ncbi:MAG: hypothetical protein IKI75_06045 [Lachnospiraceae bacterium]|nr:hypothetical protein [Lachnospiraceae bacterium]